MIVEAKPGYGMHREEQLVREVVDTALGEGAARIALIAVGADMGDPVDLEEWQAAVRAALDAHALTDVEAEVRYSSWAKLGRQIERCAHEVPVLRTYAHDAVAQLRFNALLGYDGGPVHDDLEELNLTNAIVLFNRAMASARQFYLTLHDQPAFRATGLGPLGNSYRMLRNGASTGLSQHEELFQVTTFISPYRKSTWRTGLGAFAAFYFASDNEPKLHVGAFHSPATSELHWDYEYSEGVEELDTPELDALDKTHLPWAAAGTRSEWVYDERPWKPGDGDADVTWAVDRLVVATTALDATA